MAAVSQAFTFMAPPSSVMLRSTTSLNAVKPDPPPALKKAEFVALVAEKAGLSKVHAEAALAAVIDTITAEVAGGKKISILGSVHGRNLCTHTTDRGDEISVPLDGDDASKEWTQAGDEDDCAGRIQSTFSP